MSSNENDWFTCPVCGEVVRANALACPHCGSDDETGWSDDAACDDLDLPIDAHDTGEIKPLRSRWVRIMGFTLLVGFVLLLTRSCLG